MDMQVEFRSRRLKEGISRTLNPNQELFLGSRADVSLSGVGLRPRHARLFADEAGLQIEPLDNAPTSINGKSIKGPTRVVDGDWLALGSFLLQVRVKAEAAASSFSERIYCSPSDSRIISIGRLPQCDLTIPSPLVSREHAKLLCGEGKVILQDLNSTNGTFVNGNRIAGHVALKRGDRVQIAAFAFRFTGDALEPLPASGLIRLEAHGLCKEVRDRATGRPKALLDDINLVIEPGEFVAIFGYSGSGKSTLLDALNGRRRASSGQVLYNGIDFYSGFELFRRSIGYVPQQDIVHRKISVRKALHYTARLRLPPDTLTEEIDSHIVRVLNQVGLSEKELSPIDTPSPLSGGELKRVSLAVELIANPSILFLDEVTSGLDAATDKRMMQLFAELASGQKTILCVTHTLENVEACRLVLLLHRGKMVFFGPPKEAIGYFQVSRLSDIYERIEGVSADKLAERFRGSDYYRSLVQGRISSRKDAERDRSLSVVTPKGKSRTFAQWSQLPTLIKRYIDLLLSDRRNLAMLLIQAPLIGTLIGLVFGISGTPQERAVGESRIAFMVVISAIWCGCLNSTREIVKELPIYLRERAVGLGIAPYLFSKLLPLSVLCLLQCAVLLGVVSLLASWPGYFWARLAILFLAAMAASSMGLAVSTLVDSNDKAVALVPILLIPQVILANFFVALPKFGRLVAQGTIISFSSFDAMQRMLSKEVSALVQAENSLFINVFTTCAIAVAFLLAALLGLKLKDIRT
jgi:ABC-type multidrug transport system ATPase subunit